MKRSLVTALGLVVLAFGCGRTELRIGEKVQPAQGANLRRFGFAGLARPPD